MELNYSDFGLKTNTESITFKFKDKEIEIFKYLPLEYKYDVIMCSLHDSEESGIYNYLKLDAYFHLNLFIAFVKNITFSKEQLEDKLKLYNEIYSSGLLNAFLEAVDEKEYNDCYNYLRDIEESKVKYNNSSLGIFRDFLEEMPKRAGDVKNIIESLDEDKMNQIRDMLSLMAPEDKKNLN